MWKEQNLAAVLALQKAGWMGALRVVSKGVRRVAYLALHLVVHWGLPTVDSLVVLKVNCLAVWWDHKMVEPTEQLMVGMRAATKGPQKAVWKELPMAECLESCSAATKAWH